MKRFLIHHGIHVADGGRRSSRRLRADPPKPDKAKSDQSAAGLTVAVLDFTADDPANPNAGSDMASALTAMLSGESGVKLVERQSLLQTLHEHELNLTGLVNARAGHQGRQAGRGENHGHRPRLPPRQGHVHHGQAHRHGDQPGRGRDGQGRVDGRHGDAGRVSFPKRWPPRCGRSARSWWPRADDAVDPLPALKKKLAGRRKPVVAVIVREQHHAARGPAGRAGRVIDPAVETEIKKVLAECGFTVQDVPENELTDFARGWTANDVNSWPRGLAKVDVLMAGEAFSEFAARIGNIVSCSARRKSTWSAARTARWCSPIARRRGRPICRRTSPARRPCNAAAAPWPSASSQHFADTLPEQKPKK